MCMCTWMYVPVCVHVCIKVHTCVYVCTHLHVSMCVHVYMCVSTCSCVCKCMCVIMHVEARVQLSFLGHYLSWFLRQSLIGLGLTSRWAWVVSDPQGSAYIHFLSAGTATASHHLQLLYMVVKLKLESSSLQDMHSMVGVINPGLILTFFFLRIPKPFSISALHVSIFSTPMSASVMMFHVLCDHLSKEWL